MLSPKQSGHPPPECLRMTAKVGKRHSFKVHVSGSFNFRFGRSTLTRPSVLALMIANLFLIVGVMLLGWDTFLVLALFWVENVVMGLFTIFKLAIASGDNARWYARVGAAIAFVFQYGLFTLVHGVFVFLVFGTIMRPSSSGELLSLGESVFSYELMWGALALLISHGVSFFLNYVGSGEYRLSSLRDVTQEPYGRMVLLHVTIIFGGMLISALGSPVAGLLLLIVLKMAMDIRAHLRQHQKYARLVSEPA